MPKKVLFSKELILGKAFELFKEEGIEAISARNVAKILDASPAPIYKSIGSMKNLKKELIKRAKDLFIEYLIKRRTGIKFLDIGMGISIFAREEKQLFLQVFSKDNIEGSLIEEFLNLIRAASLIRLSPLYDDCLPRFSTRENQSSNYLPLR